jgi:hypothetical protein
VAAGDTVSSPSGVGGSDNSWDSVTGDDVRSSGYGGGTAGASEVGESDKSWVVPGTVVGDEVVISCVVLLGLRSQQATFFCQEQTLLLFNPHIAGASTLPTAFIVESSAKMSSCAYPVAASQSRRNASSSFFFTLTNRGQRSSSSL